VHLHPTQLYESFAMLLVFLFLLWLHKHKRFSGQVILFYGLLYSAVRFAVEFVRDDPRGDIMGLTTLTGLSTSQMISLDRWCNGARLLIIRWRRTNASANTKPLVTSSARGLASSTDFSLCLSIH
jgi:phosphatidylglycerol:prolipoprotein diacylglycerol transferase